MRRTGLLLSVVLTGAHPLMAQPIPLEDEFRVNTYTSAVASHLAAATFGPGFVVVWSGPGATDAYGIFAQRYDASGPVGSEFRVNTSTTGKQNVPAAAGTSADGFVVVWRGPGPGDPDPSTGIFGQRYDATGLPQGGEFRVNAFTTGYQSAPAVASNPDTGAFVVVWESPGEDGSQAAVVGQRYAGNGAALGGNFVANTYTTGAQGEPAVAVTRFGSFLVVWDGQGPADPDASVYARRYDAAGSPQGIEFRVNTLTTGAQSQAAVAVDALGTSLVAWLQQSTSDDVFARRLDVSGNPAGSEFVVSTYTTDVDSDLSVEVLSADNFVIGWNGSGSGGSQDAFARRLAQGAPKGPRFVVNAYTTNDQHSPRIARVGSHGFAVAWIGNAGGVEDGVFARRFCVPRGDANFDGTLDVADIFYLINFLFASGPAPLQSADVDGANGTSVADVFYLINYLFAGGPAPLCA